MSRRNFVIRLHEPRGIRIRRATVIVAGKRTAARRVKGRFRARIDLRGLPKGRFTVAITVVTRDGRTLRGTRKYRTCAAASRPGRKRKL